MELDRQVWPAGPRLHPDRVAREDLGAGRRVEDVLVPREPRPARDAAVGAGQLDPADLGICVGAQSLAAALGGTLATGARPGGGFRVRATLPLGAA